MAYYTYPYKSDGSCCETCNQAPLAPCDFCDGCCPTSGAQSSLSVYVYVVRVWKCQAGGSGYILVNDEFGSPGNNDLYMVSTVAMTPGCNQQKKPGTATLRGEIGFCCETTAMKSICDSSSTCVPLVGGGKRIYYNASYGDYTKGLFDPNNDGPFGYGSCAQVGDTATLPLDDDVCYTTEIIASGNGDFADYINCNTSPFLSLPGAGTPNPCDGLLDQADCPATCVCTGSASSGSFYDTTSLGTGVASGTEILNCAVGVNSVQASAEAGCCYRVDVSVTITLDFDGLAVGDKASECYAQDSYWAGSADFQANTPCLSFTGCNGPKAPAGNTCGAPFVSNGWQPSTGAVSVYRGTGPHTVSATSNLSVWLCSNASTVVGFILAPRLTWFGCLTDPFSNPQGRRVSPSGCTCTVSGSYTTVYLGPCGMSSC